MYTNVSGGDLSYYVIMYLQCVGEPTLIAAPNKDQRKQRTVKTHNIFRHSPNHQTVLVFKIKCPAPNQWSVYIKCVCLSQWRISRYRESSARPSAKRLTSCIAISSTVFRVNLRLHKTNRSSRLGPSSSSTIALYRPPQIPKWYTRGTPSTNPIIFLCAKVHYFLQQVLIIKMRSEVISAAKKYHLSKATWFLEIWILRQNASADFKNKCTIFLKALHQ